MADYALYTNQTPAQILNGELGQVMIIGPDGMDLITGYQFYPVGTPKELILSELTQVFLVGPSGQTIGV